MSVAQTRLGIQTRAHATHPGWCEYPTLTLRASKLICANFLATRHDDPEARAGDALRQDPSFSFEVRTVLSVFIAHPYDVASRCLVAEQRVEEWRSFVDKLLPSRSISPSVPSLRSVHHSCSERLSRTISGICRTRGVCVSQTCMLNLTGSQQPQLGACPPLVHLLACLRTL